MSIQSSINTPKTSNKIFLNGKQLAEVLDVSGPALTEAVKNDYNCGGYPVGKWAIVSSSGRVKGYKVPEFLVSGEPQTTKERVNPEDKTPDKHNISPNKGQKPANQAPNVIHNYSLLPEGEDYVRPAGMVTLPLVLKKALDKDSPQSRVVISGMLALLGAITGHAVTDNAIGAGIGATAGLSITFIVYKYYSPPKTDHSFFQKSYDNSFNKSVQKFTKSDFLPVTN